MPLPFGREYPLARKHGTFFIPSKVGSPLGNGTIDVFFSLSDLVLVSFDIMAETINSSVQQLNFCLTNYFACRVLLLPLALTFRMRKALGMVPSAA